MYFGDMDKWNGFLLEKFGQEAVDDLYRGGCRDELAITIAYYPDINSYMGREKLQFVMSDYK